MRGRTAAALALLAAGCAAPPAPLPEETVEWDREIPMGEILGERPGPETTCVPLRVVDHVTGRPIPGARLAGHLEPDWPLADGWTPTRVSVTDQDGWALLDPRLLGRWTIVDVEGYCPLVHLGDAARPSEFRLRRGVDLPLEVRDWLDRPLSGAVVAYSLGFARAPDIRSVMTDEAGRAVLPGVDPRAGHVEVRGAGATGEATLYDGGLGGLEACLDGTRILRCLATPPVEGVVLDHLGRPVAGVPVGPREAHESTWTRTGTDGRFRLVGLSAGQYVLFGILPEEAGLRWDCPFMFDALPGFPTVLRLPSPEEEEGNEGGTGTWPVLRILLAANFSPPPEGQEEVVLLNRESGMVFRCWGDWEDDVASLEQAVCPGRWAVRAGSPGGRFRPVETTVEVSADGAQAVLPFEENPLWRPRILRETGESGGPRQVEPPYEGWFEIDTEAGREYATYGPGNREAIFVPSSGPFVVTYSEGNAEHRIRFDSPPEAEGPAIVLPQGMRPPARESEGPRLADLPESLLRVLLPDGSPAANAFVAVRDSEGVNDDVNVQLDEAGSVRSAFRRGDHVEVKAYGVGHLAPLETVVEGPGPWTFRWPTGEVRFRAVDGTGTPVPGAFVLWQKRWLPLDGGAELVLGGLPAGPVRLFVAAPANRLRDVRLILREGEKRALSVVLRKAEEGERTE